MITELKAGDILNSSADVETGTSSLTYVKLKEIQTIGYSGVCRIKFDMHCGVLSNTASGRVYKNGVAVGTEHSSDTDAYQTFSEDIGGFLADDLIQLYSKNAMGNMNKIRNFRISHATSAPLHEFEVIMD